MIVHDSSLLYFTSTTISYKKPSRAYSRTFPGLLQDLPGLSSFTNTSVKRIFSKETGKIQANRLNLKANAETNFDTFNYRAGAQFTGKCTQNSTQYSQLFQHFEFDIVYTSTTALQHALSLFYVVLEHIEFDSLPCVTSSAFLPTC